MFAVLYSLGMFVVDWFKPRRRLEAENLFLRYQLSIALRRAPPRLRLRGSDRALLVWMTRLWPSLLSAAQVVQPETIWHRSGFTAFWRMSSSAFFLHFARCFRLSVQPSLMADGQRRHDSRLRDLPRQPFGCWIAGHCKPQQLPTFVAENKKCKELLKRNRRDNEQIDRRMHRTEQARPEPGHQGPGRCPAAEDEAAHASRRC
jgi:hypothetical protein